MRPIISADPNSLVIDPVTALSVGDSVSQEYQSKEPYPYICLDNFLAREIIERVHEEVTALEDKAAEHASANEHLKTSYNPNTLPAYTKAVFNMLNSEGFIKFLEGMSGITGLIPDPYFKGGGIHRISNGGYLGIHADFNHHREMNLERRMNVLVYLNPDWKEEYGGAFEVWSNDMSQRVAAFTPIMNRMCCFSTGSDTMHGNPEPVAHPGGQSRYSMALYYYTATWGVECREQSTVFKRRPDSGDARHPEAVERVLRDYVPPVVYRTVRRALTKFSLVGRS